MKKLLLLTFISFSGFAAKAQVGMDTLLWNNFETDPFPAMQIALPPGSSSDTTWYTFDLDGLPDGSPGGLPDEWFWTAPFTANDTIGNTGVLASNSWSNSSTPTENILVTPSVYIGDTSAVLSWKSAPIQTPRYMDGYQVMIAVANNDLAAFTDTIFVASEYVSLDNTSFPNDYNSYTFNPGPTANPFDPFIHGIDGTYTDPNSTNPSDSARLEARLRPFTYDLSAYVGQTIFIMFHHYTVDDYLISIDNILVTGTDFTGIQDEKSGLSFSTYPNPANDQVTIAYNLTNPSVVSINLYDISGKLLSTDNKGTLSGSTTSTIDVSALPAGMYRIELVTELGRSNQKIVVE